MSIIKYQKGNKLPLDYDLFLKYSETAPENRRPQVDWSYGNPDQYDHYGMWDALGKPKDFKDALEKNPDWQPDESDGMYHGFSANPNTGIWLKSHTPGKVEPGNTAWKENLLFLLSGDKDWNNKRLSLVYDPEIKRMRYIEKKQKGSKFTPSPNWKNPTQLPLSQINPDTKSDTEKQTNRRLLEGADAQKNIVDLQLTFNNIINGLLSLNPNAMLYSRPTQSQRNAEVQLQNASSGLLNFARTTLPTITNVMLAEVANQGLPLILPKTKQLINYVLNKVDNYIPGSIDKLIKPKYDINIQGLNKMGIDNKQTIQGDFIKDMTPLKPGAESFVYHKGDNVFKIRRPEMRIDDINLYKKELRLLQKYDMPETKIHGYYKTETGHLQPILKQKYILGESPTYPEIQAYMKTKGFRPDQDLFRNKKHVIFDTHTGNFLKDNYGKIHPIDTHVLNKHEFAKYQAQIPSLQLQSYKKGALIKYKS